MDTSFPLALLTHITHHRPPNTHHAQATAHHPKNHHPLPMPTTCFKHSLPTAHDGLSATYYPLPIANCQLPTAHSPLPTAHYTHYTLPTAYHPRFNTQHLLNTRRVPLLPHPVAGISHSSVQSVIVHCQLSLEALHNLSSGRWAVGGGQWAVRSEE